MGKHFSSEGDPPTRDERQRRKAWDKPQETQFCMACEEWAGKLAVAREVLQRSRIALVNFMDGNLVDDIDLMDDLNNFIDTSTVPGLVVIEQKHLKTVLDRWDALETDLAIRYGGIVESVPELVEARNSLKAALEKKERG